MDKYFKSFDESDIVKNMLKDYIDKLIIYLEQDYELQDFIFPYYRIEYKIKRSYFKTQIVLTFPNYFIYTMNINLNENDLPFINKVAVDIKYMIIE